MKVCEALKMINKGNFKYDADTIFGMNNAPPTSILLVSDSLFSTYADYDTRDHCYHLPVMFDDYLVNKISIGTDIVILCSEE